MADSYLEDRSKYRANQDATTWSGDPYYDVDDKIGRPDYIKVNATTTTVSGMDVDDTGTILV
jgi:hypothetical protein